MTFFLTVYINRTETTLSWFSYTCGIFKSLGYASLTLIALWVSVFPIILNVAFENMIGEILHDERIAIKGKGVLKAMAQVFM